MKKWILFNLFFASCLAFVACGDDDESAQDSPQEQGQNSDVDKATTGVVLDVKYTAATVSGNINVNETNYFDESGSFVVVYDAVIDYSTDASMDNPRSGLIELDEGNGNFTADLKNLAIGTTYYYRTHLNYKGVNYYGKISSFTTKDLANSSEGIDLGLSVKWASHNLGGRNPEDDGDYYEWGTTNPGSTLIYYDQAGKTFTDIGQEISGTQYDAAHSSLGGNWRLPTLDEVMELADKCTNETTIYHGVKGELLIGPNGNAVFFPFSGRIEQDGHLWGKEEEFGLYWTGTHRPTSSSVNILKVESSLPPDASIADRKWRHPIRPVTQ